LGLLLHLCLHTSVLQALLEKKPRHTRTIWLVNALANVFCLGSGDGGKFRTVSISAYYQSIELQYNNSKSVLHYATKNHN
jgi:hypothetical protein